MSLSKTTIVSHFQLLRGWQKVEGGGGPEENEWWVSKFRALAKGGSSQFSASGGVGHDTF